MDIPKQDQQLLDQMASRISEMLEWVWPGGKWNGETGLWMCEWKAYQPLDSRKPLEYIIRWAMPSLPHHLWKDHGFRFRNGISQDLADLVVEAAADELELHLSTHYYRI